MLEKRPLICITTGDGVTVLGGNMRLKAAKEAGLKEVPVMLADDWTEEQRAEFVIKDNVGFGEWDWDMLANEWDGQKLEDWGLCLPVHLSLVEGEEICQDDLKKNDNNFCIQILCKDAEQQEKSYNKLIEEGYECRIMK